VDKKVVVVSITEGPYMVKKHPLTIKRADMVVINKVDLADALEFDVQGLVGDVRKLDARIPVFTVSAKTGYNLDKLINGLNL
jgi:hydrogenase nickel incorporation protein HypB